MAVESGQDGVFWGQKVGLVGSSMATVSLAQQPSSCAQPSKEQAQKRFFSGFSNYWMWDFLGDTPELWPFD